MSDNYIFGYGSLINSDSRAATAKAPTPAIPVRVFADLGYVRTWNFVSLTGFTALGLSRVESEEQALPINGVIYKVAGTMEAFDTREVGYRRVEIAREQITPVGDGEIPSSPARIWVYVPDGGGSEKGIQPPSAAYPLLQSYIDVCLIGALEYGEAYAQEFLKTTTGWSDFWLNDRLLPRRPWVHQPRHGAIDQMLDSHSPSQTKRRLFPEDYAARYGRK